MGNLGALVVNLLTDNELSGISSQTREKVMYQVGLEVFPKWVRS